MADQAEIVTMVIILLATIGLLLLNRLKGNNKLRLRFSKAVDDLEDIIEDETGLDLEMMLVEIMIMFILTKLLSLEIMLVKDRQVQLL